MSQLQEKGRFPVSKNVTPVQKEMEIISGEPISVDLMVVGLFAMFL